MALPPLLLLSHNTAHHMPVFNMISADIIPTKGDRGQCETNLRTSTGHNPASPSLICRTQTLVICQTLRQLHHHQFQIIQHMLKIARRRPVREVGRLDPSLAKEVSHSQHRDKKQYNPAECPAAPLAIAQVFLRSLQSLSVQNQRRGMEAFRFSPPRLGTTTRRSPIFVVRSRKPVVTTVTRISLVR
jgi:hypothetical protein